MMRLQFGRPSLSFIFPVIDPNYVWGDAGILFSHVWMCLQLRALLVQANCMELKTGILFACRRRMSYVLRDIRETLSVFYVKDWSLLSLRRRNSVLLVLPQLS